MAITHHELSMIIKARDEASKAVEAVIGALKDLSVPALAIGVVASLRKISQALVSLAREGFEAAGEYELAGRSALAIITAQKLATDSTLSQAEAFDIAKKEVKDYLDWQVKLGIESPLTAESIRIMWRKLVISDMPSQFAMQVTGSLADVISVFGLTTREQAKLVKALGDMAAKGYLAGQEMRQLANAGFGYAQVAQVMGMETSEVASAISDKAIIMDEFFPRFIQWAKQYEGAGKKMVTSVAYLPQTFEELKDLFLTTLFGKFNAETGEMGGILGELQPLLAVLIDALTRPEFLAAVEALGEAMGELVAADLSRLGEDLPAVVDSLVEFVELLKDIVSWFDDLRKGEGLFKWTIPGAMQQAKWWLKEKVSIPLPGFQQGTPSFRGGWARVGELGPELMNLPRGTQILSNEQSRNLSQGVVLQFAAGAFVIHAPEREGAAIGQSIGGGIFEALQAAGLA